VDRATVDVKAYWPAGAERFFEDMGTTEEAEFGNYDFVIFMRSAAGTKYYQQNDIRNENSALAAELDAGVFRAWSGHSNLIEIKFNENFEDKMNEVAAVINGIVESL